MNSSDPKPRRRTRLRPLAESLESRNLLTAGAGNTIAILPGEVTEPGGTVAITFTIDPQNFSLPRRQVALGIDVAAPGGSTVKPLIDSVQEAGGRAVSSAFRSVYNPRLPRAAVAAGQATQATIAPVGFGGTRQAPSPGTYRINVVGSTETAGKFLLGVYLPGDFDGNGTVDQSDLKAIRARMGGQAGDLLYAFDADSNRDGRIGPIDLALAQQNLGVSTTIAPIVTANLDPASDTGLPDRITAAESARFTGVASGHASVTYSEVNGKSAPVTTTADAEGNYDIHVPLSLGLNRFRVTAADSSGQTISGLVDGVNRNPTLADLVTPRPGETVINPDDPA